MENDLLSIENQGDRISMFFNKKNIEKSKRYEIVGYSNPLSYTAIVKGRKGISTKVLLKLHEFDPNLNLHWIITGVGNMFLSDIDKVREPGGRLSEPLVDYGSGDGDELERRVAELEQEMRRVNAYIDRKQLEEEKQLLEEVRILKENNETLMNKKMELRD